MNPIRSKHLVVGIVIAFILFVLVKAKVNDHPYEHPGTQTPLQSQSSYRSFNSDQSYSLFSISTQNQSILNRHDRLQTQVKGYREQTYWGSEHPIQEETRYLNDTEFNKFIREEVTDKDADVYWGAEY